MKLHTRTLGEGPAVILLHGLFGSNENLGGLARALAENHHVIGMDLRNHGRSPHGTPMDYATLAEDVRETMDEHGIERADVVGHSMGGKTAMQLALANPERVRGLVVIDIAPVAYEHRHDDELSAMRGLDLSTVASRGDADRALAGDVPNPAVRQFLLKNLARADGGFTWRIPLDIINREYADIAAAPPSPGPYEGPALFLRGAASGYVPETAEPAIVEHFPNARIETIADAGHWPHVEQPELLLDHVVHFLNENHG